MSYSYWIEYAPPGERMVVRIHKTKIPLTQGALLALDGMYLVVERLVPSMRGDPHAAIALCKLAVG